MRRERADRETGAANFSLVPRLKLISGGLKLIDGIPNRIPASPAERLPDAEAFDAYSRTVSGVAERLTPSVAHLAVTRRTRRGRAASPRPCRPPCTSPVDPQMCVTVMASLSW